MRRILVLLCLLWPVTAAAQVAPGIFTTIKTTSTAPTSVRVGCAVGSASCTGGIIAGPIDVSAITSAGPIGIASSVPADTSMKLYNNAGTLTWNGVTLAAGGAVSGTAGKVGLFTAADAVGDSIMTQSGGNTITVATILNATTLGGTLSTATQNSVTTMTALATVGTITTGVWNGTKVGLAYGGTNADLSVTGGTSQFLRQNTVGGAVTVVRPAVADLSDAASVALLTAATNTFTTAADTGIVVKTTGSATAAHVTLQSGNGTTSSQYAYVRLSSLETSPTTWNVGMYGDTNYQWTVGGSALWGINPAGDFLFGASGHIADSSGTPTINAGFSSSPSISGTDYAFEIVSGASGPASTGGTIQFGHTWSTSPVCVVSSSSTVLFTRPVFLEVTTTTVQLITESYPASGAERFFVLCRSY